MNQKLLRFLTIFGLIFISISLGTVGLFFVIYADCFYFCFLACVAMILIGLGHFIFGSDNFKAGVFLSAGLFTLIVWFIIVNQVAEAFV